MSSLDFEQYSNVMALFASFELTLRSFLIAAGSFGAGSFEECMTEGSGSDKEEAHTVSATRAGERRVALVIGNAAYADSPLRNPRNDAEAFARKLQSLNPAFDVELALDVSLDGMEDAFERFEGKLRNCDSALLYFAGHGVQVKGTNYLIPVGAEIRNEMHLRRRAFSLDEILDIMSRRARSSSLVFLDACRENPLVRSLQASLPDAERSRFIVSSGLAEVRASAGVFVAFATSPGTVALDGTGQNSPFTGALLKHVGDQNVSIGDTMVKVCKDVLEETGGRQEPWTQSALRERFCFNMSNDGTGLASGAKSAIHAARESEIFERAAIAHWETIRNSRDTRRLRDFIGQYGSSRIGEPARLALNDLADEAWRTMSRTDRSAVEQFVTDYPDAVQANEARALLNDWSDRGRGRSFALAQDLHTGGRSWAIWGSAIAIALVVAFGAVGVRQYWSGSGAGEAPKEKAKLQGKDIAGAEKKGYGNNRSCASAKRSERATDVAKRILVPPAPRNMKADVLADMPVDYNNAKFVEALQEKRYNLNLNVPEKRGTFDKVTKDAVIAFQLKINQQADGVLTAEQWRRLITEKVEKFWVSVSYNIDGTLGASKQHATRRQAEEIARAACLRVSDSKARCTLLTAHKSQCIALARFNERWGGTTYFGIRATRSTVAHQARNGSIDRCRRSKRSRGNCKIIYFACADGRHLR